MTSRAQQTSRGTESRSTSASTDPLALAHAGQAAFCAARLPWYGLDPGWRGERRLGSLCTDADGTVQYGTLLHGDAPTGRPGGDPQRRAVTVVTMAPLPRRPVLRPDGTARGFVEAATVAAAAAVAGIGLVEEQWPWHLDVSVREHWMDQQRELAAQVAQRLGDTPWRLLTLTVDLLPQVFHYRESEYGWVLATAAQHCFLAAYGRGVSAYSLAFTRVGLDEYVS
ncbi:hypothetical protein KGA66_11330 [Actinocrinis puniceicyclus]|uniref:Uncharacterized protein n=1 Tax=Actinocrinis puniceicyclus TaxID=977794 RepID=A0A8J7WJW7_9ACTN|nr:hypothetical protein [Actinocrinis puniceicyclus]MBS2963643.1 hypothetical protein [Actinocrinis puniceicyclus]